MKWKCEDIDNPKLHTIFYFNALLVYFFVPLLTMFLAHGAVTLYSKNKITKSNLRLQWLLLL